MVFKLTLPKWGDPLHFPHSSLSSCEWQHSLHHLEPVACLGQSHHFSSTHCCQCCHSDKKIKIKKIVSMLLFCYTYQISVASNPILNQQLFSSLISPLVQARLWWMGQSGYLMKLMSFFTSNGAHPRKSHTSKFTRMLSIKQTFMQHLYCIKEKLSCSIKRSSQFFSITHQFSLAVCY